MEEYLIHKDSGSGRLQRRSPVRSVIEHDPKDFSLTSYVGRPQVRLVFRQSLTNAWYRNARGIALYTRQPLNRFSKNEKNYPP